MDNAVRSWAIYYDREPRDAQIYMSIFLFLNANRLEGCTTIAMDYASMTGHLEIMQFLLENRREGCSTDALDRTCKNWELAEETTGPLSRDRDRRGAEAFLCEVHGILPPKPPARPPVIRRPVAGAYGEGRELGGVCHGNTSFVAEGGTESSCVLAALG
ncbi:hypothetical protein BDK51DRAFT_40478 [Blyttiomyces helicus]|uniref:Ankyrin repeat-containing domain protein n=1 Tax=Blyttiomyces helicus TaxID=388810 RepID=A0A4P9WES7_9FUNG|nr:hypothetical protein BDK51DRAFT_40478 [Blyttiomyces helicus]|eukprot:RKO89500.1 hypothetical protein BDK51DRAFT_40478 [Blyttiomyces helicus]